MENRLTTKQHWEKSYSKTTYNKPDTNSDIYNWIKKNLPKSKENQTSFEVGIFPAGFSTIFGDLGYQINGIDRIEDVNLSMKDWLIDNKYEVGDLICDDFFDYNYKRKYDVVSSFGFIEHFKDYKSVIKKQASLVSNEGYIVLEVPNFRGYIQFYLKKMFDKKNLDIHYVPSMNFKEWEKVLKEEGFKIIKKDYIGKFTLDFYPQKRNFIQKYFVNFLTRRKYFIKKHLFKGTSKHFSPYMIMVAKKNDDFSK
ncbi:methyltransferase domain-containing protein [Polaribacter sp. Hel1_85]|uniref:methyltransferase domain-containing protein n=1 Tax=Polaribacter sp. Hel1_85 TaxID=1250005 RepID=UPI00052D61FE|nr:methyltransferase domain-containing protein [Polaribacter sp. Hel1_85]KGL63230.1 methytransferase domain protein [Polaribacter sp. Hel1_85]